MWSSSHTVWPDWAIFLLLGDFLNTSGSFWENEPKIALYLIWEILECWHFLPHCALWLKWGRFLPKQSSHTDPIPANRAIITDKVVTQIKFFFMASSFGMEWKCFFSWHFLFYSLSLSLSLIYLNLSTCLRSREIWSRNFKIVGKGVAFVQR